MGRSQVLLALNQYPDHDSGGEVRLVLTSLISGQVLDFDVLTATDYPLDLVQEGFTPGFVVKTGQDVAGRQIGLDAAGTLPLVRLGHLFVERTVGGHAAAPLGGGAMKR